MNANSKINGMKKAELWLTFIITRIHEFLSQGVILKNKTKQKKKYRSISVVERVVLTLPTYTTSLALSLSIYSLPSPAYQYMYANLYPISMCLFMLSKIANFKMLPYVEVFVSPQKKILEIPCKCIVVISFI